MAEDSRRRKICLCGSRGGGGGVSASACRAACAAGRARANGRGVPPHAAQHTPRPCALCASPPPRRPSRRRLCRRPRRPERAPLAVERPHVGRQVGSHFFFPRLPPQGLEASDHGEFRVYSLPLLGCHWRRHFHRKVIGFQTLGACPCC